MEQIKQRFSKNSPRSSFLNDRQEDVQESFLAEDSDAFTGFRKSKNDADDTESDITLRLKLSDSADNFTADQLKTESLENGMEDDEDNIFFDTDPPYRGQTVFEVISTETIKEGRTSYVLYKILLTISGHVDENPCTIWRRYSDFEKLHTSLRKKYPHIMDQVSFPKKHLIGNFKPETIARRSRSFEQYLSHLYSLDTIRFCSLFKEFFYVHDLEDAYRYMSEDSYLKSLSLFQKVMPAQERIIGYYSEDVGATVCAITVCYLKLDEKELALKHGLLAIKCLRSHEKSSLFISLLNSCIHLCWILGKGKQKLERKLSELVAAEAHPSIPDLMDVVLKNRELKSPA